MVVYKICNSGPSLLQIEVVGELWHTWTVGSVKTIIGSSGWVGCHIRKDQVFESKEEALEEYRVFVEKCLESKQSQVNQYKEYLKCIADM